MGTILWSPLELKFRSKQFVLQLICKKKLNFFHNAHFWLCQEFCVTFKILWGYCSTKHTLDYYETHDEMGPYLIIKVVKDTHVGSGKKGDPIQLIREI